MIHIKTPCDANWQEMTAAESGKFCGACEKVVVDFSKMQDSEIKHYFTSHASQKTCGRFLDSQLDRTLSVPKKGFYTTIIQQVSRIRMVQLSLFFIASSFLWLSSCVKKQVTMGEPTVDDGACNTRLMGDTIMVEDIQDTVVVSPQEDTVQYIKGDVDQQDEMIMGKVRMTDTISQKIKRRK